MCPKDSEQNMVSTAEKKLEGSVGLIKESLECQTKRFNPLEVGNLSLFFFFVFGLFVYF